jgi:hypothetical protein
VTQFIRLEALYLKKPQNSIFNKSNVAGWNQKKIQLYKRKKIMKFNFSRNWIKKTIKKTQPKLTWVRMIDI